MRPFLLAFLLCAVGVPAPAADFQLSDGDRVVLIGNTLIERAQRHGYWETALTVLHPDKNITFRNLGWSGDTVWGEAQGRFGGPAEGFRHLKEHVTALKPTVLLVGYGLNESFAGPAGLQKFEQGLNTLLDTLAATKARIVLLGPPRQEDLGRPLPDPAANNQNIRLYADAMRKVAEKRGYLFVDLYDLLGDGTKAQPPAPLTDNGIHLTPRGYWRTANKVFVEDLCKAALTDRTIELPDLKPLEATEKTLPLPPAPGAGKDDAAALGTTVRAAKLAPGKYTLTIDGKPIQSAPAEAWMKGVRLSAGPEQEQVERLRATIVEKNQTYFYRWRPQNETYLFGFRKNEQGRNAKEIPEFDPLVEKLEQEIARLRKPAKHTYQLRLEK